MRFVTGNKYTRADIKELAGVGRKAKGGPWDTGIVEHDGEFLVFANVGTEGRTGHDYDNRWEGESLRWHHKRGSRVDWPSVKGLLGDSRVVHVFWRSSNSEAFEYAGFAKPIEVIDSTPVGVLWSFSNGASDSEFFRGPDEIPEREYAEGAVRQVQVTHTNATGPPGWLALATTVRSARSVVSRLRSAMGLSALATYTYIIWCPCLRLGRTTASTRLRTCARYVRTVMR